MSLIHCYGEEKGFPEEEFVNTAYGLLHLTERPHWQETGEEGSLVGPTFAPPAEAVLATRARLIFYELKEGVDSQEILHKYSDPDSDLPESLVQEIINKYRKSEANDD